MPAFQYNVSEFKKAKDFCIQFHEGQTRKYTGDPYHNHPFEVVGTLLRHNADQNTVVAAYLHDLIEDTDCTAKNIIDTFGPDVAKIVLEVTDVSRPEDGNRAARKELDRQHLAKASQAGKNLKLADIISNTRLLVAHDMQFGKVYLKEKNNLLPVLSGAYPLLFEEAKIQLLDASILLNIKISLKKWSR